MVFLLAVMISAGCDTASDVFCEDDSCQFSAVELDRLRGLANLSTPTPDLANRFTDPLDPRNPVAPAPGRLSDAERLGRQFYHDYRFSGVATQLDIARRVISQPARAPIGQPIKISCATCHDLARGGTDSTSVPGHVSVGAGWYDVNAQTTLNAAHYPLKYWNGRYESLVWQITSVAESFVSMNGTRIALAWTVRNIPEYRQAYERVFGPEPLFARMSATTATLASRRPVRAGRGVVPGGGRLRGVESIRRVLAAVAVAGQARPDLSPGRPGGDDGVPRRRRMLRGGQPVPASGFRGL